MQYRYDRYGNKISVLGFGCMRFTTNAGRIDIDKCEKEIMAAYKAGVNYFDTAYIYPGSEAAIGEVFERNHNRNITITFILYISANCRSYRCNGNGASNHCWHLGTFNGVRKYIRQKDKIFISDSNGNTFHTICIYLL